MVVLLVASILLVAALPNFLAYGERDRVEASAQDLGARIRLARQKALARRQPYKVAFTTQPPGYQILRRTDPSTWVPDPDEVFTLPNGIALLLDLGGDPGNTDLVLEPQGTVKAEDAPARIRIAGSRDTLTVSVVRTGRVTVRRSP
jgi:type II secretory pathway pseudopilin PulG